MADEHVAFTKEKWIRSNHNICEIRSCLLEVAKRYKPHIRHIVGRDIWDWQIIRACIKGYMTKIIGN